MFNEATFREIVLPSQGKVNDHVTHCKFLILILRKKNTENEHIIAHLEYFVTCHYSKTVWFTEYLNEIKITHYEEIFSHIKQKLSHFEKRLGINNIFVVSMRLSLFSPRCITLKQNQKIISKISNIKYIPHTPRKSSFKRNCFQ